MALARVDISGGQVSGVSDLSSAPSSVVNFDVDDSGANWPRPALTRYAVTNDGDAALNGLVAWDQYLIMARVGGRLVAVLNSDPATGIPISAAADLTTQIQGGKRPTFVGARSHIYAAGGSQIVRWGPSLALAETLVNSPRCTHIASHGEYLIANDLNSPGTWVWSDIGEGTWTTWPAANRTTAAARPDPVVALAESLNSVTVWGSESMQTYQLGSDPELPFDLVSSIDLGLGAPYAFLRGDREWWMLDHHRRIVRCDGGDFVSISDAIQKDLNDLDDVSGAWFYRVEQGQFSRLVCRFPTTNQNGRTFVYDLKAEKWREDRYYLAPFQKDMPIGSYAKWITSSFVYHMVGRDTVGTAPTPNLYRLDDTTRTEDVTVPIVCERVTGWHDHGTMNRKRSGRLRAVLKRGSSTTSTISDQGALELRVQDDDQPWSDWEQINIGDATDFGNTVDAFLGGVFRRRRYGLRYSSTEGTAIAELYDEVQDLEAP